MLVSRVSDVPSILYVSAPISLLFAAFLFTFSVAVPSYLSTPPNFLQGQGRLPILRLTVLQYKTIIIQQQHIKLNLVSLNDTKGRLPGQQLCNRNTTKISQVALFSDTHYHTHTHITHINDFLYECRQCMIVCMCDCH